MYTEFVARRAVRILGVGYAPGAVISDPEIPTRVLSTLTNTGCIAQRISRDGRPDEAARFPIATVTAAAPRSEPVSAPPPKPRPDDDDDDDDDGVAPRSPSGPSDREGAEPELVEAAGEDEIDEAPWRLAWQQDGAAQTFRHYLMGRCGEVQLIRTGSITDLLFRLHDADITP